MHVTEFSTLDSNISLYLAAIQRKYENLKRAFMLKEKENCKELVGEVTRKKKHQSWRQRVGALDDSQTCRFGKKITVNRLFFVTETLNENFSSEIFRILNFSSWKNFKTKY